MLARPAIDRGGAADRLRNHLRRRAITRLGLIEGDLYFLPYWRITGPGDGSAAYLLAAEVGDARLSRVHLPPADLKPFDTAAVPPEATVVPASTPAGPSSALDDAELIHYPFWLMRVEDSGRIEGAWIDGVEGKVIHHTLKLPAPLPSTRTSALLLSVPALLMAAAAWLPGGPIVFALACAGIAAVCGAVLSALMERHGRRELWG